MRQKPDSCSGCAFYSAGTDFSQIEGTGSSGLMVIAEASGEMEARDQLPLRPYAPAGSLFERVLRRMSIDRQMLSVTNCIRCRPRNNWLEGNPHEYSALAHCRPNLDAAIAERKPKAILAMGGVATRELTGLAGDALGVTHLAGYVLPGPNNIPTVPNFHPAFLRRGKSSYTGVFSRILQRAINVARGTDRQWMWNVDPSQEESRGRLGYQIHPSLDEAREFVMRVESNERLTLSYDIETRESASLDEDARDGFSDTVIELIQFSVGTGEGIAFRWEGEYRHLAQRLLHTRNVKCGHNVFLFDNKVLRAAGEREALDLTPRGVVHDTLQMFHHWQPDLPAHLQFAASFVQFPFPWKHLASSNIEFYSVCDVDATLRLYIMLEATLKRDQIWGDSQIGYIGQVEQLRPVLAAMEDRGFPIDDAARIQLDTEFTLAQSELRIELTALAPIECGRVHPKEGYKGVPPEVKKYFTQASDIPELDIAGQRFTDTGDDPETYRYAQHMFPVPDDDLNIVPTIRWCRVYDFNPNSPPQLKSYMVAKGHKVPKSRRAEDADGNAKDTTEKKELVRLAHSTGDTFYLKVIEYRELGKARGTYIEGFKPSDDGAVHTTFTFDTGTGQLTSRNPNVQNFSKHGRLAKPLRRMIAAPAGNLLVEMDKKSFHVLTTGFCAEDADYMRMARLDMHSFVAGHILKCWDAEKIREESDDELLERFRWFKADSERKRVRDKQAKPTILGVGFGMGARRLYQENLEHFPDEKTAKKFLSLLQHLFPKVFAWQSKIRKLAHEQQFLRSSFGHMRRFYEVFRWDSKKGDWANGDQAEEAVAFLPANLAFGEMRLCMKEQARLGLDEKYGLCNSIHDSFIYNFPKSQLEAFIDEVIPVLVAPSTILKHPTLCPDGLVVEVEGAFGHDWSSMSELKFEKEKSHVL